MPDAMRLLEILGVDLNRLQPITQPTQFDKIVLFDEAFVSIPNSSGSTTYFTNEYRDMIDRVRNFALKNRTPISNKKLFFYHGGNQVGEMRLAEYFKSKGYEIITHKQRSDFDEEINLLINCESFACILSSASLNSIFLRDGTEAIFIPRQLWSVFYAQITLNQVHPINANYVDSALSVFPGRSFCFIISEQLKRFFGDKWDGYEKEDFKTFLEYINSPVRRGLGVDIKRSHYYPVFSEFMVQLKQHKDLIAAYNMPSDWENFRPLLLHIPYLNNKGWGSWLWINENQISENVEQQLDIRGVRIKLPNYNVYYAVYYNEKEDWSEEVVSPLEAGIKHKPIYGMRIRLDEAGAKEFDILYRMHKFDGTWTPWAKNGEALYSHGQKVNAIQMKLEPVNIQPDETETEEFDDMYTPWVENEATIYLQGQRALIKAKSIKAQPDKTRTNEFDDVYTPWTKSDATIYLQGQRVRRRAKIKKDVI